MTVDWTELRIRAPLEAVTDSEYTEVARRMVDILIENWDALPDGDKDSDTGLDGYATKVSLLYTVIGACMEAIEYIDNNGRE